MARENTVESKNAKAEKKKKSHLLVNFQIPFAYSISLPLGLLFSFFLILPFPSGSNLIGGGMPVAFVIVIALPRLHVLFVDSINVRLECAAYGIVRWMKTKPTSTLTAIPPRFGHHFGIVFFPFSFPLGSFSLFRFEKFFSLLLGKTAMRTDQSVFANHSIAFRAFSYGHTPVEFGKTA